MQKTYIMWRKLIYLLLLFIVANISVSAKDWREDSYHEFRISAGANIEDAITFMIPYDYCNHSPYSNYYSGDLIGTPIINLSYNYQVKRWLSIGITASYCGRFKDMYEVYSGDKISKNKWQTFYITPIIRFDWLRLKSFKLYSNIGLGIGQEYESSKDIKSDYKYRSTLTNLSIDINPIGMSIGRKVFVFFEAGPSTIGFVKGGIGYRVDSK